MDEYIRKGRMVIPWYDIQSQVITLNSKQIQRNIDAAGSKVEKTLMCFRNMGDEVFGARGSTERWISRYNKYNYVSTSVNYNPEGSQEKKYGAHDFRSLPPIDYMQLRIGGKDYPGVNIYRNLASGNYQEYLQAYQIYLDLFGHKDHKVLDLESWVKRHNKIMFDYTSQMDYLFQLPAVILDDTEDIRSLKMELIMQLGHTVNGGNFEGHIFHYVPSSLILEPSSEKVLRMY